jgi:Fic family protein
MFRPNFTITPAMLSAISEISEIKAVVERSKVLPLNEAQLRRKAIVRMAHTSTSIEGNPLAEFQVDKVLSGASINADQKSIMEVKNYQKALELMDTLSSTHPTMTIQEVLKVHGMLMDGLLVAEKTGHFRPGPIYIVDDLGNGEEILRYEGPPSEKVTYLVNELLTWLVQARKENLHPVLMAGIFHVQFVTIHPFSDGNGRITRLLTQLILYQLGWDFRKILVLEDFYNRDRQSYYNALNGVQGKKFHNGEDLTPWLEYFIYGFLVEARKVADSISMIGFARPSEESEQIFLDKDEIKLMDFLTTTGRITSNDVEEVLGVAKRTSQVKLKALVEKGLISVQGAGPSTFYILKKD